MIPTPTRTKHRHWRQPLVTGFTELLKEFLKWTPDYGYTERTDLVTALRESQLPRFKTCRFMNLRKTTLPGGFFVSARKDYAYVVILVNLNVSRWDDQRYSDKSVQCVAMFLFSRAAHMPHERLVKSALTEGNDNRRFLFSRKHKPKQHH